MRYGATQGFIYCVRRADGRGPLKIGFSTNAKERFENIDRNSPHPLKLLVAVPGSRELERRLHTQFAAFHVRCEWFEPVADLLDVVRQLQDGTLDFAALPRAGRPVGGRGLPRAPWGSCRCAAEPVAASG